MSPERLVFNLRNTRKFSITCLSTSCCLFHKPKITVPVLTPSICFQYSGVFGARLLKYVVYEFVFKSLPLKCLSDSSFDISALSVAI